MGRPNASGSLKQLQQLSTALDLPITKQVDIVKEGWAGKPKGALQILWERGYIDPSKKASDYNMQKRKVEKDGTVSDIPSLKELLTSQPDFADQETLLQMYGRQLMVTVDRTPKCHPELAGEGIEYCWAAAKQYYRKQPFTDKKMKQNFRRLVELSQATTGDKAVLSISTVRKFSRRAREYMLAYQAIGQRKLILEEQEQAEQATDDQTRDPSSRSIRDKDPSRTTSARTQQNGINKNDNQQSAARVSYHLIERVIRGYRYKSHRSVANDDKFVEYTAGIVLLMRDTIDLRFADL
jgi:hypothetical protein